MRNVIVVLLVISSLSAIGQLNEKKNNEAVALMEEEKYEDALLILNPLVSEFPSVTSYRYNRAVTLFHLEKYLQSILDYKELFKESPEVEYVFQIANAYEQMDSLEKAVIYYSKTIELEQDNYLNYFKRGTIYLKTTKFENAINDYNISVRLNPAHHNSLHNRGIALYHLKRTEQACEDWCNAFRLGNPYSEEHLNKNCKIIPQKCK
jgi:tetratricopeptide (TPR) repeat protein